MMFFSKATQIESIIGYEYEKAMDQMVRASGLEVQGILEYSQKL